MVKMKYRKGDWTKCLAETCEVLYDDEYFCTVQTDEADMIIDVLNGNEQLKKDATTLIYANQDYIKENEQLKQALREQLEENGNAYCIEILDKIFDLKYDEWQRKMNETHTYDYIDWEKVLKDKGDVE